MGRTRLEYGTEPLPVNLFGWVESFLRPRLTILFFPERPRPDHTQFKLCALLGYAMTNDPRGSFDVAFKHKDATFSDPASVKRIPVDEDRIINGRSLDISKQHVGRAFQMTFGFPLDVDPTQYEGSIVEKSNRNATRDGRILKGPIPPDRVRAECVYEKLIDASGPEGLVLAYRVPVYGDEIPLVFCKYRRIEDRFAVPIVSVEIKEPKEVFSAEEVAKIFKLAQSMGVDYAELDGLRDIDGRLYFVDVNNTPSWPRDHLPRQQNKIVLQRLAISFDRLLRRFAS